MVQDTHENSEMCNCPNCPSHNDCMKDKGEVLYCARGKSSCEVKSKGCVCPGCQVYKENNLNSAYYCLSGKAE
ncbi:MAG: DUF2769 domain-containing protein [Candidatus Parcubacteria bacterium]|nr:DUF2769 domain-containing protein [Candidatus Parcubacteria bacterium]